MNLFPGVKQYVGASGAFAFAGRLTVCADANAAMAVCLLREAFAPFEVAVETADAATVCFLPAAEKDRREYYEMTVTPEAVTVRYTDALSARDAAATLIAMARKEGVAFSIPSCTVQDWADFAYRGLMLDPARAYIPLPVLRERVLLMAKAKYTVLHLHLLDTEGYALRSKAVPELCDRPTWRQYTPGELRALVAYAAALGITVIPEIDLPGHGTLLLQRLPAVCCHKAGRPIGTYVACVSNEQTYDMVERLIGELCDIFPAEYIHMGGDELSFYDMKDSGFWPVFDQCDTCRALSAERGYTAISDFYCHFVRRVYDILKRHGKKMMIWNDTVDIAKTPDLPRDILIMFWRVAMPTRGPHDGCSMLRFLEEGFDVVNAYYPETYIEKYVTEEKLRVWNPYTDPQVPPRYQKQVIGGEACAWGINRHLLHTLPASILLFGDRVWNSRPTDVGAGTAEMTAQILCPDRDAPDVYGLLGGCMLPEADTKEKFGEAACRDEQKVEKALAYLTAKQAEGRYDDVAMQPVIACLEALRAVIRQETRDRQP